VRFRNDKLNDFIFLIWTSLYMHRYDALPLATICTTSWQTMRGWHSSNTDVALARRLFFLFTLLRVAALGRFDTFSLVRLPLCSRYRSPSFLVALALSVCYGVSLYARLVIARTAGVRAMVDVGHPRPFARWLRGRGCVHAIKNV